jgi:hypothetical protein
MTYNPFQPLVDWLSARFDELIATLNPVNLVMAMAVYFASWLPEPDPRLADVMNGAVTALSSVIKFISLADYVVNLPVLLIVVSIILVAESVFNIIRAWRLVRSFVV